jgi:hypothetical protein
MGGGILQHKMHMLHARIGNALAGQSQLLLLNIDTEHLSARPNRVGQPQGGSAGSAADIEDAFSRHRRCRCKRGLRHASHKPIDACLLGHPAPRRFTIPECALRRRHGLCVAHVSMPLGFRNSGRPAQDGKCGPIIRPANNPRQRRSAASR